MKPEYARSARTVRTALLATALILIAAPLHAVTSGNIFGGTNPLLTFVEFITGPFAYLVVIVALVATVGTLALGGEFSGFARRMPIIAVAGGIVILADNVLTSLFGSSGYSVPPDIDLEAWCATACLLMEAVP